MSKSFQDLLSQLFREIEIDLGSTNLCILTLESLYEAVRSLCGQDLHNFFDQLQELTEHVGKTSPRYAIIIDSFYEVVKLALMEDIAHPEKKYPLSKRKFLAKLKRVIAEKEKERKALIQQAACIKISGKTILLYDHSRSTQGILAAAKNRGDKFTVIVAEQDPDKTGEIIEFLDERRIPFRVVPAYMITHVDDDIDAVFLGALTLKSTMDFVMDTGANGIVSQFHLNKTPIYVFISTAKFSLWKAEKRSEFYKHVHRRKHHTKSIEFERIKFSHDRVELNLISKIVTEEGVFTPKELKELYKKKLAERGGVERKVGLLS